MFALPARSEFYSGSSSGSERAASSGGISKRFLRTRGCELQCPPRRLLIDVGCVRSYGLKDAGRVLLVIA